MRKEGTIVRWDDAKGFGFIRSGSVTQDVFVHVRDYRSHGGQAPREGLRVTFEDVHVGGKGPRAVAVQPIGPLPASNPQSRGTRVQAPGRENRAHQRGQAPNSGAWLALPLMFAYGLAVAWLVWQKQLPWWVLPASLLLNLVTFFAYWQDKYAAQQGRWRISESTLHCWSLAGGWGGAWFAQQILRHKTSKTSFRITYWATVVVHCALAVGTWWVLRTP